MKKVKLKFMVVPEELEKRAYVPNAVKIIVIDPEAIFLDGILGQSGRKLVRSGVPFFFERKLAERLIRKNIAKALEE
ncbi:MAG: hypothetical protein M0R00_08555 [Candidatus Omnitrophica bacterium]|jgi:hypothetical protein|nr:hypothetical protein [Candidatus Omnitrophota bacterium]